jgi:hypothetical protein
MSGKQISILAIVLSFVLSAMIMLPGTTTAELNTDDMEWMIGDSWEYRITGEEGLVRLVSYDIIGENTVEIDGINYDVHVVDITGSVEDIGEGFIPSTTFVEGTDIITATLYRSKNDEITQKLVGTISFQVEHTVGTIYNISLESDNTKKVISGGHPDVIEVGASWSVTIEEKETDTSTLSGGIYGEGEPSTEYTNKTGTTNYECIDKKSVTVTAGTFEAYEIRETEVGESGNYSIKYISSETKGEVKSIDYDKDGTILSISELVSYDVTAVTNGNGDTPGFELAILICAVAVMGLLKRRGDNRA